MGKDNWGPFTQEMLDDNCLPPGFVEKQLEEANMATPTEGHRHRFTLFTFRNEPAFVECTIDCKKYRHIERASQIERVFAGLANQCEALEAELSAQVAAKRIAQDECVRLEGELRDMVDRAIARTVERDNARRDLEKLDNELMSEIAAKKRLEGELAEAKDMAQIDKRWVEWCTNKNVRLEREREWLRAQCRGLIRNARGGRRRGFWDSRELEGLDPGVREMLLEDA